jgi:hypothetical protein
MSTRSFPDFQKYVDTRIALALARASQASASLAGFSNRLQQINAAPLGPALNVTWSSSSFTSKTGKVLVMGALSLQAGGGTSGDTLNLQLLRGGAIGVQLLPTIGPAAGDSTAGTLLFIDSPAIGTPVTYGIFASAAHNITVAIGGAIILVQDWPA